MRQNFDIKVLLIEIVHKDVVHKNSTFNFSSNTFFATVCLIETVESKKKKTVHLTFQAIIILQQYA